MADVFISFSRLDQDRVKPIADRLSSLGFSVWWDRAREGEIADELESARAVLAVWSLAARDSTQMHGECAAALDGGKLMQLRLDTVQPPTPFDCWAVAEVGEWGPLEAALAKLVREGVAPEPLRPPQKFGPFAVLAAAGSPKILTLGLSAALAAYATGVLAAINDVMSVEQLQLALVGMIGVAGACAALGAHRLITISRAGG